MVKASITYTPRFPTSGWLMSELERRGHVVRGTELAKSDKEMAAILRGLGLDVWATRKEARSNEKEDRGEYGGSSGPLFEQEQEQED